MSGCLTHVVAKANRHRLAIVLVLACLFWFVNVGFWFAFYSYTSSYPHHLAALRVVCRILRRACLRRRRGSAPTAFDILELIVERRVCFTSVYRIYLGSIVSLVVFIAFDVVGIALSFFGEVDEDRQAQRVYDSVALSDLNHTFDTLDDIDVYQEAIQLDTHEYPLPSDSEPQVELQRSKSAQSCCGTRVKYRSCMIFLLAVAIALMIPEASFVYRIRMFPQLDATFSVLGSVSHNEAKILFRNPNFASMQVAYKPAETSSWITTPPAEIVEIEDWVITMNLTSLVSNTTYDYKAVWPDGTEWVTLQFTTFPPQGASGKFSFSFGSCAIRTFPSFNGPIKGYEEIVDMNPDFMLHIGDQIYIDSPLYLGPDTFLPHYRDAIRDEGFQKMATQIPLFQMYDDHEVLNDWDKGTKEQPYPTAMDAWNIYAGNHNPSPYREGVHYFSFDRGDTSFFLVDSRAYRSNKRLVTSVSDRSMLGQQQLDDVLEWLLTTNSTSQLRFLVSSVPWTLNTNFNDSWFGYSTERNKILDFITTNGINNVILLSGDTHYTGVFKIRKGIYEFNVSPIDAFSAPIGGVSTSPEERLFLHTGKPHRTLVEVDTSDPSAISVHVAIYEHGNAEALYTQRLSNDNMRV